MNHEEPHRSSRLQFTQEERNEPALQKPIRRAEKAAGKLEDAQAKIPKRKVIVKERTVEADTGKKTARLHFVDVDRKPPSKLTHVLTDAPAAEVHRQIAKSEEDNVGVAAAHKVEQAVEGGYRVGRSIGHAEKMRPYRNAARAEKQSDKTNLQFLYEKAKLEAPAENSTVLSRWQQRQGIKRQYAAAKAGRTAADKTATSAGKATQSIADKAKRVVEACKRGKGGWVIAGVLGLLVLMLTNSISSCSQFGMGGMQAILSTSYVSEDQDIQAVEKAYTRLEDQLDRRMDNIEREYPGYDEYRYDVDEIGHNPYVLMSYLTAKYTSFTLADVQGELDALFQRQYSLNLVETVETRYRTEPQPVPTIDPRTGRETTVIRDVEVPYEYKTLSVELRNRQLAAVVSTEMDAEQAELYAVLMETRGNKPELFPEDDNPFVGELDVTPPEPYAIPPEALSDPAFAALIAEANKYLGYPYVWGGSKPSTSFDCSGFVCWVLNQSGVASVGRTNARGLYKRSTVVSKGNARPGDLVFFTGARAAEIGHPVTHVGIYIGNDRILHCAGNGVEYKNIASSKYYRTHLYAFGRLD